MPSHLKKPNYKLESKHRRMYDDKDSKGVHKARGIGGMGKEKFGQSSAGYAVEADDVEHSKEMHREKLEEQRSMKKPNLYAEGGSVLDSTHRRDNEKGVHKATSHNGGKSEAHASLHPAFSVHEDIDKDVAKRRHVKVLGELKAMKKPKLYAQGGSVGEPDPKKAAEMQKGATSSGVPSWDEVKNNVKSGLGMARGGAVPHPDFVNMLVKERSHESDEKMEEQAKAYDRQADATHNHKMKDSHRASAGAFREAIHKRKKLAEGGMILDKDKQDKVAILQAQDKDPEYMKAKAEELGLTKYEAHGGEIESDEELHHAIGHELMDALEKKDKKGIMSALEAAIMQCMGKD